MVLAYHLIFGTYGFWLPNDPRGSWSEVVRSFELRRFGPATKVTTRNSLARRPHDVESRRAAKTALARPPVLLTGLQARAAGRGFAAYVGRVQLPVWACAILPDHVHLVLGRHVNQCEENTKRLKEAASKRMVDEQLHPFQDERLENGRLPPVWAAKQWIVFLASAGDIRRCIKYVEDNPLKEGKPRQRWPFVSPFIG